MSPHSSRALLERWGPGALHRGCWCPACSCLWLVGMLAVFQVATARSGWMSVFLVHRVSAVLRIATGKGKRVASVLGAERRCPWCRCSGRPRGRLAERRCSRCWASVISVPASDLVSLLRDCCAHRVLRLGRASSEAGWRVAWIGAIERWYGWVRLAWGRV